MKGKSKNQRRREHRKQQKREPSSLPMEKPVDEAETDTLAKRSSVTVLARKYEWLSQDDPLHDMYANVSKRFKRARTHADLETGDERQETFADSGAEYSGSAREDVDDAISGNESVLDNPDNNDQTRATAPKKARPKPALADLKIKSPRPDLIEWFDADSMEPELLVHLKTLPHVVQVPSNWRNRSEIPNFASRPPYEPPEGVRDVVGPRVDYEAMYSAFFGRRSGEPDLLKYGEVADLRGRARAVKAKNVIDQPNMPPSTISERLRKALGLTPGAEPPWAAKVKELGPAPGYAAGQGDDAGRKRWGYVV